MDHKFLLFLLVASSLKISLANTDCENVECNGPFIFEDDHHSEALATSLNATVTIQLYQENTMIMAMSRWYYKSYCYNGGALDPNTGCEMETTPLHPDQKEAKVWADRGACQIGNLCSYEKPCYGSDSTVCIHPTLTDSWVHERKMKWAGKEKRYFAWHTCILDWSCSMKKMKALVELTEVNDVVTPAISLPNGTRVPIEAGRASSFSTPDGTILVPVTPTLKSYNSATVICAIDERIYCSIQKGPKQVLHSVFNQVGQRTFIHKNAYFTLTHNQVMEMTKRQNSPERHENKRVAASEVDLKMVENMVHLDNAIHTKNALILQSGMTRLNELLVRIVKSSSHIDDELIGNLLDFPSRTKWLNPTMFKLCSCSKTVGFNYTNCDGGMIYDQGRFRKVGKSEEKFCRTWSRSAVKKVNLMKLEKIETLTLRDEKYEGIAREDQGWSWLAQRTHDITSAITLTHESGDPKTKFGSLLSLPSNLAFFSAWSVPFYTAWTAASACFMMFMFYKIKMLEAMLVAKK